MILVLLIKYSYYSSKHLANKLLKNVMITIPFVFFVPAAFLVICFTI